MFLSVEIILSVYEFGYGRLLFLQESKQPTCAGCFGRNYSLHGQHVLHRVFAGAIY